MPFRAIVIVFLIAASSLAHASTEYRTVVVRERGIASLLNGAFVFKLLKIKGYSIEVRALGRKRVLKIGQSFSPKEEDCSIIFEEIATETRIARFKTNCP